MASKDETQYHVLVGINYPPSRRADPGDIVSDLPPGDVKDLLRAGVIEKYTPVKEAD